MFLQKVLVCLVLTTAATAQNETCDCIVDTKDDEVSADCENKGLKEVPSCVPNNTTDLKLSGNMIEKLNAKLTANLKNLRHLDVSNCQIANILPNAFSMAPQLRTVKLSKNSLRDLPDGVFDATPLLEIVNFSGNVLLSLPRGLFKRVPKLIHLDLSTNYLPSLPDDLLGGCGEKAVLHLRKNHLTTLPVPLIDSCLSIVDLDASNNDMTALPEDVVNAIGRLSHLNTLQLQGNPWNCECDMAPLAKFLQAHEALAPNLTCQSPPDRLNHLVVPVVSELDCPPVNVTAPPVTSTTQPPTTTHPPETTTVKSSAAGLSGVVVCGLHIAVAVAFFTV